MKEVKGYRVIRQTELSELRCYGTELIHEKSGAHICCIENPQDANKVFTIGFCTPPENHCGIPHILEHSVLCGSEHYPLKDPFVELAKGSVNTYLNAMTYPDKTLYPVASMNEQDLHNLVDVYMDAVFYPNIRKDPRIFMQEGWHNELEDVKGEVTRTGVVYNEMKGVYSSPDSQLSRWINQFLFPDTPFGMESGGLPSAILNLNQEDFLEFYERYYHPSNSYIYLYGDMDMEKYLEWFDKDYLSSFDRREGYNPVKLYPYPEPFSERVDKTIAYPVSEETEEDGYLSYNVATGHLSENEMMALDILEYLLVEMQGAPIKKALMDRNLGKMVYGEADENYHHATFSIIAKGVDVQRKEEFIQVIEETLQNVIREGFSERQKLSAINRIGFLLRESDHGSFPEGLYQGISGVFSSWIYGADPFLYLSMGKVLEDVRKRAEQGYLEEILDQFILKNPHQTVISMEPSIRLAQEEEEREKLDLILVKKSMKKKQLEELVRQTKELHAYQEEEEDPEILRLIPHLQVKDIKREVQVTETEMVKAADKEIIFVPSPTGDILYTHYYFDLKDFTPEEMAKASLLSVLIGCMDTEKYPYAVWSEEVHIHTGGIMMDTQTGTDAKAQVHPQFTIAAKILKGEESALTELLLEALLRTDFSSVQRLRELVGEEITDFQSHIENDGHSVALDRALSKKLVSHQINQWMDGLDYYQYLKDLQKKLDQEPQVVIEELQEITGRIFTRERLQIAGGCDQAAKEALVAMQQAFCLGLPERNEETAIKAQHKWELQEAHEGWLYPGKVLYNVVYARTSKAFTGAMWVARHILSLDYLWTKLRVQGGAYGAFCGFTRAECGIYLVSYRDPNLKQTYDVYTQIAAYFRNFECSDEEMEKYILGTIGGIDIPRTPSSRIRRGILQEQSGYTLEENQRVRDQVLSTTVEDLRELAEVFEEMNASHVRVTLGNEEAIKQNQELFDTVLQVL